MREPYRTEWAGRSLSPLWGSLTGQSELGEVFLHVGGRGVEVLGEVGGGGWGGVEGEAVGAVGAGQAGGVGAQRRGRRAKVRVPAGDHNNLFSYLFTGGL